MRSPMPLSPGATMWQQCEALLLHRRSGAAEPRAAHALLATAGLLRHRPDLALLSLNSLLRSLSPTLHLSLPLFRYMLSSSSSSSSSSSLPPPDHHTFPFALSACVSHASLVPGAQLHAVVLKNGLSPADHFVQTALLRLYSRLPHLARHLFDETPHRDPVHYDVLMTSYLRSDLSSHALRLFRHMLDAGIAPDSFVLTTALTACAHSGALDQGIWIHRYLSSTGPEFLADTFIGSALVSMYAKCGCIKESINVFAAVPNRNTHMWAAMVGAFASHGLARDAIACLDRMQHEDGLRPDAIVLLCVLTACAHSGLVEFGLALLAAMRTRYNVPPVHEHYSCAVDMLCRVGRLDDAAELIKTMPMKPKESVWGSVLTGCRTYGNVVLAETAVAELNKLAAGEADDEGVYVQLSNIYLNANRKDDARRIRKLIGSRGVKKAAAVSAIEVDGAVSSFVAGDQAHPLRVEIWGVLDMLVDHMECRDEEEEEDDEELELMELASVFTW
ncbi:putative pentatricopeptide repeat-containing protein At3g28640 [Ananas comosus]|uniref:Pentatricopeptide repeat-containing protein At3g28640 n=1 Tax=Ananas comosus TaxID=4615 RepID=A0A6P5FE49_ANACO|nr:putative pentatricopeptide repeat-containing protein At3g28640 [Ananas comosus]